MSVNKDVKKVVEAIKKNPDKKYKNHVYEKEIDLKDKKIRMTYTDKDADFKKEYDEEIGARDMLKIEVFHKKDFSKYTVFKDKNLSGISGSELGDSAEGVPGVDKISKEWNKEDIKIVNKAYLEIVKQINQKMGN